MNVKTRLLKMKFEGTKTNWLKKVGIIKSFEYQVDPLLDALFFEDPNVIIFRELIFFLNFFVNIQNIQKLELFQLS